MPPRARTNLDSCPDEGAVSKAAVHKMAQLVVALEARLLAGAAAAVAGGNTAEPPVPATTGAGTNMVDAARREPGAGPAVAAMEAAAQATLPVGLAKYAAAEAAAAMAKHTAATGDEEAAATKDKNTGSGDGDGDGNSIAFNGASGCLSAIAGADADTTRAGLLLPVSGAGSLSPSVQPCVLARVYLTAVLEYVVCEIVELARGKLQYEGNSLSPSLLTPAVIAAAIAADTELHTLFPQRVGGLQEVRVCVRA